MSEKLSGQTDYAFPFEIPAGGGCGPTVHFGMTLRDYFAAKAMQGMVSVPGFWESIDDADLACNAYVVADAMLSARVK